MKMKGWGGGEERGGVERMRDQEGGVQYKGKEWMVNPRRGHGMAGGGGDDGRAMEGCGGEGEGRGGGGC